MSFAENILLASNLDDFEMDKIMGGASSIFRGSNKLENETIFLSSSSPTVGHKHKSGAKNFPVFSIKRF